MPNKATHSARAGQLAGVQFDETSSRRTRLRRGGPRTPLPLLPLIAALAGVGVAYVSQTAHSTQATYQATTLAVQNQRLRVQARQLGDELARLQSGERIIAAAQALGMRPAGSWTYVDARLSPVVDVPAPPMTPSDPGGDPLQQVVAAIGSAVGVGGSAAPR